MRTTQLSDDLAVGSMGLGCMGMSGTYGPADWDRSIATIHRAIERGISLIDTANIYGMGHNEVLVGRGLKNSRDKVTLATKFGVDRSAGHDHQRNRGERDYALACCDASLLRLAVDHIDLYYLHRPPDDVPIEETIGAMAELVTAGKVGHLGVSELTEEQLRRACATHPIAVMQSEYSLWTREVEAVAPAMAELNVGLVTYSPLGRGFLTGTVDRSALTAGDFRATNPRFTGNDGEANEGIANEVRRVADDLDTKPATVALAWVYRQSERLNVPIVTIPGTTHPERIDENLAALELELPADALNQLDPLGELVRGERYGRR